MMASTAFSQEPKSSSAPKDTVTIDSEIEELIGIDDSQIFNMAEQMPAFPGGEKALFEFIRLNVRYPNEAIEDRIEGTVFLSFIIEKDGMITNVNVERGVNGGGLNEEAVRVIKSMPNWHPARNDAKQVRVNYSLPIKFKLTS